jgi:hypothetical protein
MRFRKDDIERHTEGGYGCPYPAVNVKVYSMGCTIQDVVDRFGCSEEVAEKALQFAYEMECESFWEYWQDTTGCFENGLYGSPEYAYFPGEKVMVYGAGRSGGWLIVQGLPPVEEWDAIAVARWNKFQKAVKEDVKYKMGKDVLLEDIDSNRWYLEHSTQFNYFQKSDGSSVCIAEVKADIIAYAEKTHGFVPALP